MRAARRACLVLALAAPLCACRQGQAPAAAAPERAPNFTLKDLGGKTVRLSDFQGKVVVLDFWATYCEPCHDSIPVFKKVYEEYRARGVEVVGVSLDPYAEAVPDFVRRNRMAYTVLLDPDNEAAQAFSVRALPTTLLLDRKGAVRQRWLGFDEAVGIELRAQIDSALKEPAA